MIRSTSLPASVLGLAAFALLGMAAAMRPAAAVKADPKAAFARIEAK